MIKKLSVSKDWKQHNRETHKINANKKKAGLAISISSKVTLRVKKKKKKPVQSENQTPLGIIRLEGKKLKIISIYKW